MYLKLIDDEIFPEDRKENRFAHAPQILNRAGEKPLVGQHRDAGGSVCRVLARDLDGGGALPARAGRGGGSLELRYDREGLCLRDGAGHRPRARSVELSLSQVRDPCPALPGRDLSAFVIDDAFENIHREAYSLNASSLPSAFPESIDSPARRTASLTFAAFPAAISPRAEFASTISRWGSFSPPRMRSAIAALASLEPPRMESRFTAGKPKCPGSRWLCSAEDLLPISKSVVRASSDTSSSPSSE